MTKAITLDNLKYIVKSIKRHIKEIIAYVIVFSVVCFVISIDFLPQTMAVNESYNYSAAYSIDPIFPKTSNFTFYGIKKPKGDNGNEMEDYANYQAFVGYAMIWNLTYKSVLKNFEGSETLKNNLYKIAEDIADSYDIDDKEKLMVYKFTYSKFGGLYNTYGFILAESSDYEGSAIFVGCSDKIENDKRFYFMEDSGATGHSFIDNYSDEFKNTRNYAQNFTKLILKVTLKERLVYNGESQKLLNYSPSNITPSFKLNGNDTNDISSAKDDGEYNVSYSISETDGIANLTEI